MNFKGVGPDLIPPGSAHVYDVWQRYLNVLLDQDLYVQIAKSHSLHIVCSPVVC